MRNNLFRFESEIRGLAGMVMVAGGVYVGAWVVMAMGAWLAFSGLVRYCPIYDVLGVNRIRSRRDYYLSRLPHHNPEPVYIFGPDGRLQFRNESARSVLPDLMDIGELFHRTRRPATELIASEASFLEDVAAGDRRYALHFKGVRDLNAILAYGFDMTEVERANREIIQTQKDLIYRMGEIGETRSQETGNHVKRVAEYSYLLAGLSGLDENEAETLRLASPMHDIGKVAIPDSVLKKPGRLSPDERKVMDTHAEIGFRLLNNSERPILKAAAIVAHEHHEKWDGSGYPRRLAGTDIHIFGRITALADVFDALGSERVYKKAWPMDEVLDFVRKQSGAHFDPTLADLLLNNLDRFLEIRDRYRDV